jgi:hypothetical protein
MKTILISILTLFFSLGLTLSPGETSHKQSIKLPVYSHIVIVIEENKDYNQIIGNADAPYINNVLVKEGANLTQMYAEEHFSEGNYFWLLSGNDQGVGHLDITPTRGNNKNYPFTTCNLGEQLIRKGYTFKGYAESLPAIGDTITMRGYYARKHVPWVSFANIPNGTNIESSSNLQFKQFPKDFNKLPTVSIVVPNLIHDMHNGRPPKSVEDGDKWLKENLNDYYQWAKMHNSLLIITFDENSDKAHYWGYTNPASKNLSIQNRIPTLIAGAHIKPGNYAEGNGVTHVNILRTIEAIYGLQKCGQQQNKALKFGISNDYIIQDIFSK